MSSVANTHEAARAEVLKRIHSNDDSDGRMILDVGAPDCSILPKEIMRGEQE